MSGFRRDGEKLIFERSNEIVQIQPWGTDSLRVRTTANRDIRDGLPGALLAPKPADIQTVMRHGSCFWRYIDTSNRQFCLPQANHSDCRGPCNSCANRRHASALPGKMGKTSQQSPESF